MTTQDSRNAPLFSVDDLVVGYGTGTVLSGLCMRSEAHSVLAIVGRNGTGKTTLTNCIAGMVPARSGRLTLRGTDISHSRPRWRWNAGIALVPQGRRIFPSLTVDENLRVARARPGRWGLAQIYEDFASLRLRMDVKARSLSGGEQQMLAIGRALLGNPRLILLDEPSEGLAVPVVNKLGEVMQLLRNTGTGVILVEQNLTFALTVADEVAVMAGGSLGDWQSRRAAGSTWDRDRLEAAMGIQRTI